MGLEIGRDALLRALNDIDTDLGGVMKNDNTVLEKSLYQALGRLRGLKAAINSAYEKPEVRYSERVVPAEFVAAMEGILKRASWPRPTLNTLPSYIHDIAMLPEEMRRRFLEGSFRHDVDEPPSKVYPPPGWGGKWWAFTADSGMPLAPGGGEVLVVWTESQDVELAYKSEGEDAEWVTPDGRKIPQPLYWLEILHPVRKSQLHLGKWAEAANAVKDELTAMKTELVGLAAQVDDGEFTHEELSEKLTEIAMGPKGAPKEPVT